MRIIGIDPGMAIAGYCVLDIDCKSNEDQYIIVNSGSIQTSKKENNSTRLLEIHNDLTELIKTYSPDVAAVEQIFYFKNAKTIVPVCEARGVIIMTLKMYNIPIYEYTPLVVKQTITGYGRAEKAEIKNMIQIILQQDVPKLDDTCDAIAIALCHSRQQIN
ncbi:MAG: crossover junction endodeoxyribonuclease RuvC [Candidatus Melainabacteria bacterium RIFOXYA12_FULL_32_12]|nr:MAG: crossover junction endodeoxyribonuclease RuvC [Candidatus Melainabacteria bacterium GWF2_32_7]OGI22027.1 MAG: crossover junction endodeoxyribonuclease RuvC [Candidatus Melainabacteria bacterium RIFOXYA2_FULL_32_9]OGI29801.1 MAG: crossover junction endodeoxyribonuclease RuvC [Candidatus Melainabacteria bacterium RIFOXYA12_FULL_32_12]